MNNELLKSGPVNVGNNNSMVVINGDNNVVGLRSKKSVIESVSSRAQRGNKSILDFLNPYSCRLSLVGREGEISDFLAWLTNEKTVAARLITGQAGSGKTRFAIELLFRMENSNIGIGGFIPNGCCLDFLDWLQNSSELNGKTLIAVIDYAAAQAREINKLLHYLSTMHNSLGRKVRILLIDRNGGNSDDWFAKVKGGSQSDDVILNLFEPGKSYFHFETIDQNDKAKLAKQVLEQIAENAVDGDLTDKVSPSDILNNSGSLLTPLDIIMGCVVKSVDKRHSDGPITRNDLALRLVEYELARIDRLCGYDIELTSFCSHIGLCITLIQGISVKKIRKIIEREKEILFHSTRLSTLLIEEKVLEIFSISFRHDDDNELLPVGPDLVGEYFVRKVCSKIWKDDDEIIGDLILRCASEDKSRAIEYLVHVVVDMSTSNWRGIENSLIVDRRPLGWLERVSTIAIKDGNYSVMLVLSLVISSDRLIFTGISTTLCYYTIFICINIIKAIPHSNVELFDSIFAVVISLINEVSESGYTKYAASQVNSLLRKPKIKKRVLGEPAVLKYIRSLQMVANIYHNHGDNIRAFFYISKAIDGIGPSNSYDDSASIYTLASEILRGMREKQTDALAFSMKAVDFCRRKAISRGGDDSNESLAACLVNLSNIQGDIGLHAEALPNISEAVAIYRVLKERDYYSYYPVLAKNLHNLSNRLADLGMETEAKEVSIEATNAFRVLYERFPDVYREFLAGTLLGLGNLFRSESNLRKAKVVIEEALVLYEMLVRVSPKKYLISLCFCYNQLGIVASLEGNFDGAICFFTKGIQLIRSNKKALFCFENELSTFWNNIAENYIYIGDFLRARGYAKKACRIARRLLSRNKKWFPATFAEALDTLAHVYYGLANFKEAESQFLRAESILTKASYSDGVSYDVEIQNIKNHYIACKERRLVLIQESVLSEF